MNLEKVLRLVVLVSMFALPFIVFIVSDNTFFPYIVGKNIAFRSIIEIMFGAWVLLALIDATYRPRWTVLLVSVTGFVAIVALADFLGENAFKSVWSNFERMDGLVTLVHALMYAIVVGTVATAKNLWLWFWRVSIMVSTFVSIHALGQLFIEGKTRLDATLGNPIYLAVYLLFHIFITLVLIARPQAERIERVVGIILLPLFFTVLFFTATRGATLGLVGGLLLATIGIAVSLRGNHKVRLATGIIALLILTSIGTFFLARNTTFVQENHVLKRFATLSLSEGTVYSRTLIWRIALEGIKEKPLLGWGQENFNFVFNQNYDPRMYGQESWFDRTHNIVFDWLIAAGILGFLAYISIFLATLWTLYRTSAFTIVQKWLLVGLLAGYSFHNLTVFDNVISYLLFFTVLAWIYASADDVWWYKKGSEAKKWELPSALGKTVGVPVLIAVIGVSLWFVNVQPFRVSTTLLGALSQVHIAQLEVGQDGSTESALKKIDTAFELFKKAEALGTYGEQEVVEQWGEATKKVAGMSWVSDETKNKWYAESVRAFEEQKQEVPNDARHPFFLGAVHYSFGNFAKATEQFKRALELSPNKQRILSTLTASTANMGDFESALAYAKQSFEADPEYKEARILYANVLIHTNSIEEAINILKDAPIHAGDERILNALIVKGFDSEARELWEEALVANESISKNDTDAIFALVRIYVQRNDITRAQNEARYMQTAHPELSALANQALGELETLLQQ